MTATRGPIALKQKARLLPADMDTPISLFMGMAGAGDGILLESAAVDGRWGRYSILACDMLLYVSCQDGLLRLAIEDDRLSSLQELDGMPFAEGLKALMRQIAIEAPEGMEDLPPITRALYGYVGFEAAGLFTPKLAAVMPKEEAEVRLALPGTVLVLDHVYNRLCQVSIGAHREVRSAHEASVHPAEPQSLDSVLAEPCEAAFKAGVDRIRAMLAQGEAIQAVPSVRFSMPWRGEAFTLYRRLRRINASPYMFYMRFPGITLFGSSPEVMVRCAKNRLQLSPIAGTRRRGRDAAEDLAFEKELLADPKERAEHVMLVDLGRNDLGRVAARGTVKVDRLMQVERFSHVMHMTSHISALIRQGLDPVDV
ncbi:MAG: anthranilate synthase component I family protein, partial [Desulfovibrio sp.]|nr:anthranilate synthase component I family protein [Desulfovibrio sp.]